MTALNFISDSDKNHALKFSDNNNNKVLFSLKHVTFVNEKKWGVRIHVDI